MSMVVRDTGGFLHSLLGWAGLSILSPHYATPHTHPELILGLLSGVCGAVRGNVHGGGRLCRGE